MRRLLILAFLASSFFLGHAATAIANTNCRLTSRPDLTIVDGGNPRAVAAAWLPAYERLLAAIPALSPREEAWLDGELRGESDRHARAFASREYALRAVRQNIETLAAQMRAALAPATTAQQAQPWLIAQAALVEALSGRHLNTLLNQNILRRDTLPFIWVSDSTPSDFVEHSILLGRAHQVRMIALCTLPATLGLDLYAPRR